MTPAALLQPRTHSPGSDSGHRWRFVDRAPWSQCCMVELPAEGATCLRLHSPTPQPCVGLLTRRLCGWRRTLPVSSPGPGRGRRGGERPLLL
ncbi:hypothetical protein INR49_008849 [Caranx melampygus]|nr:hypothetical protein INR49_008849 [Caranx melampygus]